MMLENSALRLNLFCFVAARWRLSAFMPRGRSRQDVGDDLAVHIGEAEVAAAEAEGQAFMIQSHEVQDRGVQVMDVDFVFD